MNIKNSQKGFIVGGIVAVVALALIVTGAFAVSKKNDDTKITTNTQGMVLPGRDANDMIVLGGNTSGEVKVGTTTGVVIVTKTDPAKAKDVDGSEWKVYTDSKSQFQINYPAKWQSINPYSSMIETGISFGILSDDPNYDGELFIKVYPTNRISAESVIRKLEKIESERGGKSLIAKENIMIDGVNAIKLTVTNKEIAATNPTWEYNSVVFENDGLTYELGNGAIKSDKFEKFYKSFKFLKNPELVFVPLMLTSQNDAEIYYTGSTTEITWTGGDPRNPPFIYLEQYKNGQITTDTAPTIAGVIASSTATKNIKTFVWKVGDIYEKGTDKKLSFKSALTNYLIRIEDPQTGKFVRSRVPFTIIN